MRFVRSSRLVRPGARPTRSRPGILLGGGGGAPSYSSSGRPTHSAFNNSGSSGIFPANWGETTGHMGLVAVFAEHLTAVTSWTWNPPTGIEILDYATAKATGGLDSFFGVYKYTYGGTSPMEPNILADGVVPSGISLHGIAYYTQGSVNVYCENLILHAVNSTGAWADSGWEVDATNNLIAAPAVEGISDGTNWQQYTAFGVGDEAIPTDPDTYWTRNGGAQTTGGSDASIYLFNKESATPMPSDRSAARIAHADFTTATYCVGFANVFVGLP